MPPETELLADSRVRWSPWEALAVWAAGVFGTAVWLSLIVAVFSSNGEVGRTVPSLFIGQLALWAAYGLGPILVARKYGGSLVDQFRLHVNPTQIALWGFVGLAMQIVVLPLVYLPLGRFIDAEKVGEAAEDIINIAGSRLDAALLFIMIVIIAPVVEELFFRGMALPAIVDRLSVSFERKTDRASADALGIVAGIVISSLWFAASHLQVIQFPGLLAVGLALAFCRMQTKSLIPAIALHMVFNGVTFGILMSRMEF